MSLDETRVAGPGPQETGRAKTPNATLLVVHASEEALKGQRFPVREEDVTLGREEGNTILIPSDQASRRHARIFLSGGAHVLVDLDSTNGTYLNSKLVKEQTLRSGDVVRIATTVLKYVVK